MDKIYCGSGKEKKFDNGGSIIAVTLDLDELIREYSNHGYINNKGTRCIRIDVSTRRSVGEYGDTHSVSLNQWHPDSFNPPAPLQVTEGIKSKSSVNDEDLVF